MPMIDSTVPRPNPSTQTCEIAGTLAMTAEITIRRDGRR